VAAGGLDPDGREKRTKSTAVGLDHDGQWGRDQTVCREGWTPATGRGDVDDRNGPFRYTSNAPTDVNRLDNRYDAIAHHVKT
jgi:hypothetical protein